MLQRKKWVGWEGRNKFVVLKQYPAAFDPLSYIIISNSVKNLSIFRTGSKLAHEDIGNMVIEFNAFKALEKFDKINISSTENIFLSNNGVSRVCSLDSVPHTFHVLDRKNFYFTTTEKIYESQRVKIICTSGLEKNQILQIM